MAISLTCTRCASVLEVADAWATRAASTFACPACGEAIFLQGTPAPPLPMAVASEPRPALSIGRILVLTAVLVSLGGVGLYVALGASKRTAPLQGTPVTRSPRVPDVPTQASLPQSQTTTAPNAGPPAMAWERSEGDGTYAALRGDLEINSMNLTGTLVLDDRITMKFGDTPNIDTGTIRGGIFLAPGEHSLTLQVHELPGGTKPKALNVRFHRLGNEDDRLDCVMTWEPTAGPGSSTHRFTVR